LNRTEADLGIERIGKGATAPPEGLTPKDGTTRPTGPARDAAPFEVHRKDVAPAAEVTDIKASPALEGVRSGALDVNGYLDAKVREATAHLSHLSPAQLHAVESVVRAQLISDPHLAELVQHATGSAVPKEDE
jgi:hypothetical protein